jgi:HD-GYP domain-containing protein (c-di-GMP phosphodiesterase class II)
VFTCCHAFNAMTTTRAYRQAMAVEAAVAELERYAGTQFDPTVVAALLDVIGASQAQGAHPARRLRSRRAIGLVDEDGDAVADGVRAREA